MYDSIQALNHVKQLALAKQQLIRSIYRAELSAVRSDKKQDIAQRNYLIIGIIVISAIALLILYIRNKNRQSEAKAAETKLNIAKEKLNVFTKTVQEKNSLLTVSEQEILKLREELNKGDQGALSLDLEKLYESTILTDREWDEFCDLFKQVTPWLLLVK